MKPLVLLIDHDEPGRQQLGHFLGESGFRVIHAADGHRGQAMALQSTPQVIVMDLLLPKLDGLTVLQRLRRDRRTDRTPVLLLSALGTTADKVSGFNSGADDYLTKPFAREELLARVKALLRSRAATPRLVSAPEVLSYGPLTLVPERYEAIWFDQPVRLTHTEFELLHCLLQRHGQAVSWALILREVWGYGPDEDIECIRTHIRHLRGKLEDDRHRPVFIKTIYGKGYCLDLPLQPVGWNHNPPLGLMGKGETDPQGAAAAQQGSEQATA